jgi:hypothetical protein
MAALSHRVREITSTHPPLTAPILYHPSVHLATFASGYTAPQPSIPQHHHSPTTYTRGTHSHTNIQMSPSPPPVVTRSTAVPCARLSGSRIALPLSEVCESMCVFVVPHTVRFLSSDWSRVALYAEGSGPRIDRCRTREMWVGYASMSQGV